MRVRLPRMTHANIEPISASSQPGVFASFFGPDPLNLLGVVILTSLGTWGLPQMVQKFYQGRGKVGNHSRDNCIKSFGSEVYAIPI